MMARGFESLWMETKQVDLASIYALTKYSQEQSCLIVGPAYGIQTVALRLFNVFGPGQALSNPYTGVLANFGSRLRNGQRPMVFEDGQQKRDFVHVRDVARGFRLAMECPAANGHVINIGSGRAYTIASVAEMLAAALGVPALRPQILARPAPAISVIASPTSARRRPCSATLPRACSKIYWTSCGGWDPGLRGG